MKAVVYDIINHKVILNIIESCISPIGGFDSIKKGMKFEYVTKKNEDSEMLLGKVVYLGFTGAEVTSVEISDE